MYAKIEKNRDGKGLVTQIAYTIPEGDDAGNWVGCSGPVDIGWYFNAGRLYLTKEEAKSVST